jgi:hypothetical protein
MLNLNKYNPINLSILSLFAVSMFLTIILYLLKPSFIYVIDTTGKHVVSFKLVVCYAITFSLAISIAILLSSSIKEEKSKLSYYYISDSFSNLNNNI